MFDVVVAELVTGAPLPVANFAVTRKSYSVPFVNPETTTESPVEEERSGVVVALVQVLVPARDCSIT